MERVPFAEILEPANVAVGLAARDRMEVLRSLVALLPSAADGHREEILASVLDREAIQVTGVGYGIAIPHGKADIEPPIVGSVAITREPVDYGSIDGTPTRIFILMVSRPDVAGPHVKALAHVARLLGHRTVRERLLGSATPGEVLSIIRGEERP
jgi:PTS system nitrogen regulatory IIA component